MDYKCIEIRKVYRHFLKGTNEGLKKTSLALSNGDIVAIIGSSDSGKSTLVDLLSGQIKPTEGKLDYDARKISRMYDEKGIKLNKNMSVFDNMIIFGKREKMNEIEVENRMAQIRDIFSLNKYINTKISELDDANRVKCELAMLLLASPRMLFIDEAFLFLNNAGRNEVLKCLKRLNKQEKTIIVFACHNISDVDKIANRVVVTHKNEVIYDDSIDNFKSKYLTKKVFEVFLNKNVSINKIDGVDVLESGDYTYKLLFNNEKGMFAKVIELFDVNTIVDLKISDQETSDIIEKIRGMKND